jgi:hypothetical protein
VNCSLSSSGEFLFPVEEIFANDITVVNARVGIYTDVLLFVLAFAQRGAYHSVKTEMCFQYSETMCEIAAEEKFSTCNSVEAKSEEDFDPQQSGSVIFCD